MNSARRRDLVASLCAAAAEIATVDTHQHLGPEKPCETDLCRLLLDDFYLSGDLAAAGLTPEVRGQVYDPARPLLERWDLVAPFWGRVRFGSYARSFHLTVRDVYGIDRIDRSIVVECSARLTADFGAPGLYRRILKERCNIDCVLTQGAQFAYDAPRFHGVARPIDIFDFARDGAFERAALKVGIEIKTADDLPCAMEAILRAWHAAGAVGFKLAALPWRQPAVREIHDAFRMCRESPELVATPATDPHTGAAFPLICLCVARTVSLAEELNVPVALHASAPWSNWLDFRQWEPTGLIPLLMQFKGTRFDLYHAGMSYDSATGMMGKVFPNLWLNLCWTHVVSPEMAARALAEWMDIVPMNKILGFGGDYHDRTVPLTYGHLVMARRTMAGVLAQRIENEAMSLDDARSVLRLWLSDNPRTLYRLP